jgi:hypothetical protein
VTERDCVADQPQQCTNWNYAYISTSVLVYGIAAAGFQHSRAPAKGSRQGYGISFSIMYIEHWTKELGLINLWQECSL